jgi:serine/threonine-protein kinase
VFCATCKSEYPENWKVCPKDQAPLLRSSRIGKYTITDALGVGGMGAVYRAINPDTHGEVAIKVMHDDAARSEANRTRFKREAAAVAKLKTTHVVKVYDFGAEADGTLYLVMELLDGHTLRDEIDGTGMDLARVQFIADGVLKGLSAAHKANIVHRDLKPENIYIANTDDGEVPRILDFGIARLETPDEIIRSGATTRPGMVMGTAVYMAPEQLQGLVSQVGKWSDVYAVGAMLYEMLAGKTQVNDGSLAEVLIAVRRGGAKPLAEARTDVPRAICDVVERCVAIDSKKRPQDADELRTLLASTEGWGASAFASVPPTALRPKPSVAPTSVNDTEQPATAPARPGAVVATADTLPAQPAPVEGGRTIRDVAPPPPQPVARTQQTDEIARFWLIIAGILIATGVIAALLFGF